MEFAWATGLLALAALLIPVAIHLLQRGQHREIVVATTRLLTDSTRTRWRKIRLHDAALLALRCGLLAAAAVLLAEPFVDREAPPQTPGAGWTVVSPRVAPDVALKLGSSAQGGGELRWLSAGLPLLDQRPAPASAGNTWSLVAQADAQMPPRGQLTAIVPADADNLGIARPGFTRDINWIVAPASRTASVSPFPDALVVYDPPRLTDAQWIARVFDTWSRTGLAVQYRVVPQNAVGELAQWTVWLSDAPVPKTGESLTVMTDREEAPRYAIARGMPGSVHWKLSEWWRAQQRRLNVAAGLTAAGPVTGEPLFAELLLARLADDAAQRPPPAYPLQAAQLAAAPSTAGNGPAVPRQSLIGLFAVMVSLLWCAERLVSAWTQWRAESG